eukprot:GGOE01054371.1.p1 GENE.GGOE01054371.1~~GGOE01054371.1.p1  ORF type:complete len:384 (-),score=71.85 GGOE01054371.1:359-1510(-)
MWLFTSHLAFLFLVLHAIRYWVWDSAPIRLVFQPTKRNDEILCFMKKLPGRFYPTPYMVSYVLQTLFVVLLRLQPAEPCHHQLLEVEPGEQVMLTWFELQDHYDESSDVPIVFVLHGIDGNAKKAYARHMAKVMRQRGWRAVIPTRRGCNPEIPNQRCYEYGDPDFAVVVEHVAQRFPKAQLFAVGLSAGSNIVTKYVGVQGEACRLSGAVSVANGYDFDQGTQLLSHRWFWNRAILHTARRQFYYRHEWVYVAPESPLQGLVSPDAVRNSKNFREFDEAFRLPLHKFESLEAFYAAQSCIHNLDGIARPMLFLHAEDDPISSPALIPFSRLYNNPHCIVAITNRGGHLGWAQGWFPFHCSTWAEDVTADYFNALLQPPSGGS